MGIYTYSNPSATDRSTPTHTKTSDAYARAAKHREFRPCDLRLAREPRFRDRPPNRQGQRLGDIVHNLVAETGEKALRHWLDAAARAETEERRQAAMEKAQGIAKRMGLPLANFLFGRST